MSEKTPLCDFGWKARNFELIDTNNHKISLESFTASSSCKGFVVMFICNHCPYVNSIIKKLVKDCLELKRLGIYSLAICSNDSLSFPEDSFENMKTYCKKNNFNFPYLHDPDQKVAQLYDAKCTPDFFGFNRENSLQYRGRFDSSGKQNTESSFHRELFEAMKQISTTGKGPENQIASIGCSIKWK